MSDTFALKVSIDGSKYVIRGVNKASSKKQMLCILAKYKTKEQLPDLQRALSKLNSSVTIIKCKKSTGLRESTVKTDDKRLIRKNKKNSIKVVQGLAKKTSIKDANVTENAKTRHNNSTLLRSNSLNEKERKQAKCHIRKRPNSFGTFDEIKLMKNDQLKLFKNIDRSGSNHSELESTKSKCQYKQKKLPCWLETLKRNSITYYIEDIEAKSGEGTQRKESSFTENITKDCQFKGVEKEQYGENCEYPEAETDSGLPSIDYESSLDTISRDDRISLEQSYDEERIKERQIDSGFDCSSDVVADVSIERQHKDGIGFTENDHSGETESQITAEHSEVSEYHEYGDVILERNLHSHQTKNKNGSLEDVKSHDVQMINNASTNNSINNSTNNNTNNSINNSTNNSTNNSINNSINNSNGHSSDIKLEVSEEGSKAIIDSREKNEEEVNENIETWEELKCYIEKISKIDEDLLYNELLISQLEFQLSALSEEIDDIDDADIEMEEMKMISELKETEEFLKAITRLGQYQREAQSEIIEEMTYLEAKIKERQVKLNWIERRLIRQRFKCIPRHLNVCKERRLYSKLKCTRENEIDGEISLV